MPWAPQFSPKLYPLRRREREVPGWGSFVVCTHIVRIDIDEPGRAGTHGWQLRYAGTTQFFSDTRPAARGTNPLRGNPQRSLQRAVDALARRYRGPQRNEASIESKSKAIPTGHPGVRVVLVTRNAQHSVEVYVEACALAANLTPKRFYVGTQNTQTDERLESALRKAVAFRKREKARLQSALSRAYQERLRELRLAQSR